jgi:uncharacterized protein (TIGR00730 family)
MSGAAAGRTPGRPCRDPGSRTFPARPVAGSGRRGRYTVGMSAVRRYRLRSEALQRAIDALVAEMKVPPEQTRAFTEMLTTVLKTHEDGAALIDLKIANAALKELRHGFRVFAPYRHVRKVTVFGSARTAPRDPISRQARAFGRRMTDARWMVMTGAGSGVMGAAQEGAGRQWSFGLNIRLPFEQEPNQWIAGDSKLISFRYFFTRKFFLVREAHAMAFLPGGFGTWDEAFEALTLIQTGKSPALPVVLLDAPGGNYWLRLVEFIRQEMLGRGMIAPEDLGLFRVTDDVDTAVAEIRRFYRVFYSVRKVGDDLVMRLNHPLPPEMVTAIGEQFADILRGPARLEVGPPGAEGDEKIPPRLVLPFTRFRFARLRALIDFLNTAPGPV